MAKAMNQLDTFQLIASLLDDASLTCLSCTCKEIQQLASNARQNPSFWQARVYVLMQAIPTVDKADRVWKWIYYSLESTVVALYTMRADGIDWIVKEGMQVPRWAHSFYSTTCTRLLLDHPVLDCTMKIDNARSVLVFGCYLGNRDVASLLLQDTRVDRASYMMMLCSACRDMQFEVVQLLLEHSLLDERLLKDELTVRVLPRTLESTDSILMVSLLLLARVMTPVTYYVIMNNVTVYGYVEVLKMLLLHPRIDPACNRSACLKYACMSERAEVVRLLLDDGRVDVTEDSIHHGLSGCNIHPEILELLLSNPIVAHSDKCAGLRQVLRRATLARRVRDAGL